MSERGLVRKGKSEAGRKRGRGRACSARMHRPGCTVQQGSEVIAKSSPLLPCVAVLKAGAGKHEGHNYRSDEEDGEDGGRSEEGGRRLAAHGAGVTHRRMRRHLKLSSNDEKGQAKMGFKSECRDVLRQPEKSWRRDQ